MKIHPILKGSANHLLPELLSLIFQMYVSHRHRYCDFATEVNNNKCMIINKYPCQDDKKTANNTTYQTYIQ